MAMRAGVLIPSEELWDQIEANYWASMREVRAAEDAQLDAGHRAERRRLDLQKAALVNSQSSLVAERAELLRRLEAINGEFHKLEVQKSNLAHDVTDLEVRFQERRHALYEERVLDDANKREILYEYRRISKLSKTGQSGYGNEVVMEAPPVRPAVSAYQEPSGLRAPPIPPLVVQPGYMAQPPFPTQPPHVQYGLPYQPPQPHSQPPQPPYQQGLPVQATYLTQHRHFVERPSSTPPAFQAGPALPIQQGILAQQNDRPKEPVLSQPKPTSQPVEKEPVVPAPPVSEKPARQEPPSGTPKVSENAAAEKLSVPAPRQSLQNPTERAQEIPDAGPAMDLDKPDEQRAEKEPGKMVETASQEAPVQESSALPTNPPDDVGERVPERSPGVSEPTPQAAVPPTLGEGPEEPVKPTIEQVAEKSFEGPFREPHQSSLPTPTAPIPSIEPADSTPPKTTDQPPAMVESRAESPETAMPEQTIAAQASPKPSTKAADLASRAATIPPSAVSKSPIKKPRIAVPEQGAPVQPGSAETGDQQIAVPEKPTPSQPDSTRAVDQVMSDAGDIDRPTETREDVDMDDASLSESSLSPPPSEPAMQFEPQEEPQQKSVTSENPAARPSSTEKALDEVLLVDVNGAVVERLGRVERLGSHWVECALSLPIKRTVTLRLGKKFSKETLGSVCGPTGARGPKWLSYYIQTAGEIQAVPCQMCARANGPFQECVLLNSDQLPRCGNCEWTRSACNLQTRPRSRVGSSSEATGSSKSPKKKQADNQVSPKSGFTAVNANARASPSGAEQAAEGHEPASGFKPPPDTRKARSGFGAPASTTPLSNTPAPEADSPEFALPDITKATLTLRDDGVVFTDPPCMRGVPLAKITPEHEYWEKSWKPIEKIIQPGLQKRKAKYEQHVAAGASQSTKFLANRQVNRGKAILKYLEGGELHPYQIFGKEYITKTFTGYDTLFRLVQTLEELGNFLIDVTPSQWLRQRLCEICEEQGADFNLSKTVHDLYHDPKLTALRVRSGFRNIGRPPSYKFDKPGESAEKSSKAAKRKEVAEAQQPAQQQPQAPPSGPGPRSTQRRNRASPEPRAAETTPAREAKKPRLTSLPALEYEGYTSSDSYSKDRVMPVDWRIHQVKTRDYSSSCDVTQYWHWVDKADGGGSEGDMFEHQVLRDMKNRRVLWGVYKKPINFHLRLSELTSVTYAVGTQKVVIRTRQIRNVKHRGDVMAYFKRERTKRRFLEFMQNKGVKLIKTNSPSIENAWRSLESDVLPPR